MANFGMVVVGKDKKNILDMIDILRKSVEDAESISVCNVESYSDLNKPWELCLTIKMRLIQGERTNG